MNAEKFDQDFENAKIHFLEGLELFSRKHWAQAEAAFKKSLEYVPDRISTLTNLCATLINLQKFDEARILINNSLLLDENNAELILNQGLLLSEEGRHAEASKSYKRATELNPDYAEAWSCCGNALNELKEYQQALVCYDRLIEITPEQAEIWSNRGNILSELNRHPEALDSYDRALQLAPQYAEIWNNRGIALSELKRHQEALASYDKAVQLNPEYADAWNNRGNTLSELKRWDEALESYKKVIQISPNHAEAWNSQGNTLNDLKRYQEALDSYEQVIKLNPDYAEVWNNRGVSLNALKRHDEALISYEQAARLNPDYAEVWSNRGNTLGELKRHQEALDSHERAIKLDPDYAEGWSNRGNALNDLKRHQAALDSHERAISLKPDYAEAWSNRGIALYDLKLRQEALASYERAISLKPDYAEAWCNRGNVLSELCRQDEAVDCFGRAIELNPDSATAHFNMGLMQLKRRQFPEGFKNYVWRWETKDFPSRQIQTTLPHCASTPHAERVLLWAEQGIGDEVFYAGLLAQGCGLFPNITLSVDKRLRSIFERSFPAIELIDREESQRKTYNSGFDAQAPIGDLGLLIGLDEQALRNSRKPFLLPDAERTSRLKLQPPFTEGKIVCGLSWRSANKSFGKEKSIDLIQLKPLLTDPRITFINLQYGETDDEINNFQKQFGIEIHQIKDLDLYNDIEGLLALINACDIVITTSNVTAHLAGSIGKQGCILVPFSRGKIWYWHLDDAFSFWYPSLKILHQDIPNDWSSTIGQAVGWLKNIHK